MRRPANDLAGSTQATPEVNVRVGRVVLHSVDARAGAGLGGRVQAELARLIAGGAPPGTSATSDAPAAGGAHDALAARIAQAVYARLPR